MNPSTKPLVWWALLGAVLVSTGLALGSELAKRRAVADYQQARMRLSRIKQERDQLSQQLTGARQSLQEQTGHLTQLQADLSKAEQEVSRLQADYARLQQTNSTLSEQLAATTETKAALEAKLSSIKSLKLAIRDLRRKQWLAFWQPRWQRWLARSDTQRKLDEQRLAQGNHGLLVRNGLSTLGSRTKLQVRVLDPQSQ